MTQPQGIDVSVWQGDVSDALKFCQFAFARASIGISPDGRYPYHLAQMKAAGNITGAYHFLVYGPGGTRQALYFLSQAKDAQILACDMEGYVLKYPGVGRSFIAGLKANDPQHRPILLYSSEGTWPGRLGQDANWVANWSQQPRIPWKFWQRSGIGLDRDVFNGMLADLQQFAQGG